ncbi:MAG: hypothetical protein B5766_02055 [Candidatus Lumbricidophila eiseniae]|uniref:Uncharacterized protein n=1 Tax=Candidatus Lumbricidiphila eiseniae TaxID=1969409 RepID=A0A2A6FU91_9MICO|nr:MAG: hypothetical protein B5766_02055 [Candidatus Lumbricidophila eiseniae]
MLGGRLGGRPSASRFGSARPNLPVRVSLIGDRPVEPARAPISDASVRGVRLPPGGIPTQCMRIHM